MAITPYVGGNTAYPLDAALTNMASVTTGITAFATGGKANATPLTNAINEVTVVGTAADSVLLPLAAAGAVVYVANLAANSLNIFAQGTDTINAVATGTATALATTKNASFFCTKSAPAGNWRMILSA